MCWGCRGRFDWVALVLMAAGFFGVALLAGNSPRRATYFSLLRQRKVGKRKATLLAASPALRFGAACGARGRGALRNSLRSLRSLRSNNRSKSVDQAWACCAAQATPPAARLGASRRGLETTRAIAALGPESTGAERSDGPIWNINPSGRAEKHRAWGGRSEACALCSGSLRLSERRAAGAKRVPQRRPMPEHRRLPEGTRPAGSPFLWFLSFGEAKERDCAAGRTSRPTASTEKLTLAIQK